MEVSSSRDRIVVGVDGSAAGDAALSWGCTEAVRRGGVVIAVRVAPLLATVAGAGDPNFVVEYEDLLHRAVERAGLPDVAVISRVRCGYPVVELESEVTLQGASLLVVGRRGTSSLAHVLVGSVSSGLAQDPQQPLVIVPGAHKTSDGHARQHIVVGVDGSEHALAALRWAASEAERCAGRLEVVTAWSMPRFEVLPAPSPRYDTEPVARRFARKSLTFQMARMPLTERAEVTSRVCKGDAAEVLLRESRQSDLLVVGTRGQGFIRQHVLGSTSHAVLQACDVPLVIVPSSATPEAVEDIQPSAD